ncbi:MAG: hypothetical protein K0R27_5315, partial [Xanthobacteraceae bacterium]|nr:hypothetical protein [Xanthobacteraceae bacterium]
MDALLPDMALVPQHEQPLGREFFARRVDRSGHVAGDVGLRRRERIGRRGDVDDLQNWPVGRVDELQRPGGIVDHPEGERVGLTNRLRQSRLESRQVQRSDELDILPGVEQRVRRVEPLRIPQARLRLGERMRL